MHQIIVVVTLALMREGIRSTGLSVGYLIETSPSGGSITTVQDMTIMRLDG